MVRIMEAIYDGKVLHLEDSLSLEPNTRVRITIETVEPVAGQAASFLRTARSLNLDGPRDWAVNLDAYLYNGGESGDGR